MPHGEIPVDALPLPAVDGFHPLQAFGAFGELATMGHASGHLGLVHLTHVDEDVDLDIKSIEDPERYPLVAR